MRSILLNLTTSLDGFIADANGGIGWLLPPPGNVPQDYISLIETVDTLVMGRITYETSLFIGGGTEVFRGKTVYVFTRHELVEPHPDIQVVHEDPVAFVRRLRNQDGGGTIWVFGGGEIATLISDAQLIDEYLITLQPMILGHGVPLWRVPHAQVELEPVLARTWPDGVVELRYRRITPTLRIRQALPGDESLLRKLRLQAVEEAPDAFETTLERELARTDEDWRCWLDERATFLLEHEGEPRGLVAGVPHRSEPAAVYLIAMWVHPGARGTGGADGLVTAILAWAATQGARSVYLDVGKWNDRARRLYKRQGFRETGREWTQERNGIVEVEMKARVTGSES